MQHHGGIGAQVVKHGGGFIKKQRQVVLNARSGHAVSNVFVNAALGRVPVQQLTPAAAKASACVVVHRKLAPREQPHLRHGIQAALAVGIERADAVNLVIKQVHTVGHQAAHGEQVNQAAAHGVFTWAHHLRHMAVAGQSELRLEPGLVELLLDLEMECIARQKSRWR